MSWAEAFFLGLLGLYDAPGGSSDEGSFATFPKGEDSEHPIIDVFLFNIYHGGLIFNVGD